MQSRTAVKPLGCIVSLLSPFFLCPFGIRKAIPVESRVVDRKALFSHLVGGLFSERPFCCRYGLRRKMQEGDSHGGQGLHSQPLKEHKNTVIWMHGRGDTAHGWVFFAEQLRRQSIMIEDHPVVHTKFILPTADTREVTIAGGLPMPAWADMYGFPPDAREDEKGYLESRKQIIEIIKGELKNGIAANRIILGGYSQGGAIAYLVALTVPKDVVQNGRLGGVATCSSWLPIRSWVATNIQPEALQGLNILHCHGTGDSRILPMNGRTASNVLQRMEPSLRFELKEYVGVGHAISEEGLRDVTNFISTLMQA